jgi:uncharacterized protein (DUF1697 family)
MADLKALYEAVGLVDVSTYIQSGNVIFSSPNDDRDKIKSRLESAIEQKYSFQVPVEIRTASEFKKILSNVPFNGINPGEDGAKVLVSFLSAVPAEKDIETIKNYVVPPEQLEIQGQEVYLHCPNGYGRSKLSNVFLEAKLKVTATTRNLRSIAKLCELAGI